MHKLLFLSLAIMVSCTSSAPAQSVLDATQVESMMKADKTIQVIDIRTPAEWQQTGVIEGARRMNYHAPDFQELLSKLDKKKPVIVYCAAGGRSPRATAAMLKMGFSKIYDYTGGMNDWLAKGKKTVR